MRSSSRCPSRLIWRVALAAGALLPAMVQADTIYVKSGKNAKPFPTKSVTINRIGKEGDVDLLYYTTENGDLRHRPLDEVSRIDCDAETTFSRAEAEYESGDFKSAAADYRKALANSSKDWVRNRSNIRLLGIADQIGDFSGAVAGFVDMTKRDPATAAQHKPSLAGVKPDQLDSAIALVNKAVATAKPDATEILLPYLIDLYTAKGDDAQAGKALAMLKKAQAARGGGASASDAGANSAAAMSAKQAESDLALANAAKALDQKQYDQVIKAINASSRAFVEPEKQMKALYMLAEAKSAVAATPDALADAGLAYMQVVANFRAMPNAPVAEALYKTGQIEEKLQKPAEAIQVYRQVISEYKDSPAAKEAEAALARIK